jgi:DNA-binding LytR/AlgR family response regulator
MNILIVEDEAHAAMKLRRMLSILLPDAFIHGPLESVVDAVQWIQSNPAPDLILLDIHLSDGLSFEIFDQAPTSAPIIFVTAYDQYALRAFKLNSVDYLLKPVEAPSLKLAIEKYKSNFEKAPVQNLSKDWHHLLKEDYTNRYKKRFVTRIGERLVAVNTVDIAYAFSEEKATYLRSNEGRNFLVDFSLEQLDDLLDPDEFFRLNRKYTTRFEAVDKMLSYSNSRIKVELKGCEDKDIVLSREKTREFRAWLDK